MTIVRKSDDKDEWYDHYFECVFCGCQFMFYNHSDDDAKYCPGCGKKIEKIVTIRHYHD